MTRDVICYVTNNTPYEYYPATNLTHGQKSPLAAQSIAANADSVKTFYFSKSTGSSHGVTGSVTYGLNDGSTLFIGFNCPYDQGGPPDPSSNCWFYAGLTNIPSYGTAYAIYYNATIDGQEMNPTNPANGDTWTVYLTIDMN